MSLWSQLLKTYDVLKNDSSVNDLSDVDNYLLKDGLLASNVDIEVMIDDNANFIDARLIPKEDVLTIIPATAKSVGRTSGASAHPLFDKLDYIVNDWSLYVKSEKFIVEHIKKYTLYINNLEKWADYTQFKQVKTLYKFFQNNNILKCLLEKINFPELEGKTEIKEEDVVQLKDYMVRFIVGSELPNEMWKNQALYDEWSENYATILGDDDVDTDISYLNGELEPLQTYFPQKIRHQGDGAKLLSANDTTIVTFGGRFDPNQAQQAVTLGQSSMQRALFTLRWLINKQGYAYDGLTVLTWNTGKIDAINAFQFDKKEDDEDDYLSVGASVESDKFDAHSNKVVSAIANFGQYCKDLNKLSENDLVNVVVLDGERQGRISICYYNEFESSQYYANLKRWFEKTQWHYNKDGTVLLRTPTFYEIFGICYFKSKMDKKMRKAFLKQVLPCVIENKRLAQVLINMAFQNVRKRSAFSSDGAWWNGVCTTCALINNYRNLGGKYMELDKENTNRSYLFGRLLAVAENIEYTATRDERSNASTNAERLFTQFTMRPNRTWFTLEKQLQPYYDKLYKQGAGGLVQYFKNLIQEILSKMEQADFMSNKAVDEMFILGYYGQRNSYKNTQENEKEGE